MYQVIRVGLGFTPVIVVTPPGADFDNPEAQYHKWEASDRFRQITKNEAWLSFSGQADGVGYEVPPEDLFPSLEAVKEWALPKFFEWWEQARKRLEEKQRISNTKTY